MEDYDSKKACVASWPQHKHTCAVWHHEVQGLREKQSKNSAHMLSMKESLVRQAERLQSLENAHKDIKDSLEKLAEEVKQSSIAIAHNSVKTAWLSSMASALVCGIVLGIFNFVLRQQG